MRSGRGSYIPDVSENVLNTQRVDPERTIAESGSRVEKYRMETVHRGPLQLLSGYYGSTSGADGVRVKDGIEEDTEDFVSGLDLTESATNVHSVSTPRIGQIVVRNVVQEPTPKSREQLIRA